MPQCPVDNDMVYFHLMAKKNQDLSGDVDHSAIELALREAGAVLMDLWPGRGLGRELEIKRKPDGSAVTEADLKSHDIISKVLTKAYPNDFLLSEEAVDNEGFANASRSWILDPLDCTEAYIRGDNYFSIFLSLRDHGSVIYGAMYYPALGELYIAEKGRGATCNGVRIKVSNSTELAPQSVYVEAIQFAPAPHYCDQGVYPVSTSAMLAVCKGQISGALIRQVAGRIFCWDFAPISLIVEESGGSLTLESGKPISFLQNPISCNYLVASNKLVHSTVLGLIPK